MRYTFAGYKGRTSCTFDCSCGAKNRKRTFSVEHTVNPFNSNPDGRAKQAAQVMREAQEAARYQREQFLLAPLCKRCEDALPYCELQALIARRMTAPQPSAVARGSGES